MRPERWTPEEIATIKSAFNAGKIVKIIAEEVGRTPSAVNKFLSRSGIRQRRWTIDKQKKSKKIKVYEVSRTTLERVYKDEYPTDFSEVLKYLKSQGINVSINDKKAFAPMNDFAINSIPVSRVKLLLMANRLRVENNLPIFKVPELSWD